MYAIRSYYGQTIRIKSPHKNIKKRCYLKEVTPLYYRLAKEHYFLCLVSLETVNLCLPLALLRASTFLPFTEAILSMKPCLFV